MTRNKLSPEQIKVKNRYLLNTYGITYDEWKTLTKNGCFICGSKKRLAVDHRHVKNFKKLASEAKREEVRGALCFRHNKFTIGGLEIDKQCRPVLERVVKYFTKYKIKGDK